MCSFLSRREHAEFAHWLRPQVNGDLALYVEGTEKQNLEEENSFCKFFEYIVWLLFLFAKI